jgi:hypothetical protein
MDKEEQSRWANIIRSLKSSREDISITSFKISRKIEAVLFAFSDPGGR